MISAQPRVSVVLVNLNGAGYLPGLLSSLNAQTLAVHEVLVVDNGSTDDSADIAYRNGAKWVPLGSNVGLAAGLDRGAAIAAGDLLLFVNNDMRFEPDFVETMVAAKQARPDAFAIDAVQVDWTGAHVVHAGVRLQRDWRHVTGDVPGYRVDTTRPIGAPQTAPTVYASAANLLVRTDDYRRLGGFDTGYFLGHEDIDLGWRAWLRGEPVVLAATARSFHDVSATSRTAAGVEPRSFGSVLGKLRFAAKHLPIERFFVVVVVVFLGTARATVRGRPQVHLRASASFIAELPSLWRERQRLYRDAGTTPRRHLRTMTAVDARPC